MSNNILPPSQNVEAVSILTPSTTAMFIENVGQFNENVQYHIQERQESIWLENNTIWITSYLAETTGLDGYSKNNRSFSARGINLKLSFIDSSPDVMLEPFLRSSTAMNYLLGNNPEQWHTNVPVWGGVRYKNIYPGIDLEVKSEHQTINFYLLCKINCQTNLKIFQFKIEGAEKLVSENHQLFAITEAGKIELPHFYVSNEQSGMLRLSPVFSITNNKVTGLLMPSFKSHHPSQSNADNPDDLIFATYLNGSSNGDFGSDIATDANGNAYVTGWTWSADFPTTPGAFDTNFSTAPDGFVVKTNSSGEVIYSTFLGGMGNDCSYKGCAIAVGEDGSVYITGITTSSDFPATTGAYDTTYNGSFDAFVTKLNANGNNIIYSTFLGASGTDIGTKIAVDGNGNAYVVGVTDSTNFPVTNGSFDITHNGGLDVFVAKLNNNGTSLDYSTFIGGSLDDCPQAYGDAAGYDSCAIVVDNAGYVYITGSTFSNDFPTTLGAFNTTYSGDSDGFIVKLNNDGSSLIYSTYIGGTTFDRATGIAIGNDGSAYVVGWTYSADFPTTPGSFDTCLGITPPCESQTNPDAFVVKLSNNGYALNYATYLGGDYRDFGHDIVVDSGGKVTLLSRTEYGDFPTTLGAYDTSHNGNWDGAIVQLNSDGSQIDYGTFFGSGGEDFNYGHAIALGKSGQVYVTGNSGYSAVVVARFTMGQITVSNTVYLPLILRDYMSYFQGSYEVEPNNDAGTQANGPIVSGKTYFGALPPGDVKDYFYIILTDPHTVEAWLTNIPSGQDYDLVLRDSFLTRLEWGQNTGSSDEHILSGTLAPGKYYIQIVSAGASTGSSNTYQLKVTYR